MGLVSLLLGECGNDAALEQADIGVRFGGDQTGREMILNDDHFGTPGSTWAAPGPHPTRNDAKPRETMHGVEALEIPSPVGRIGRKPYAARGGPNQAESGRIGLGNRCSIP